VKPDFAERRGNRVNVDAETRLPRVRKTREQVFLPVVELDTLVTAGAGAVGLALEKSLRCGVVERDQKP
jgi:hypothetical protein